VVNEGGIMVFVWFFKLILFCLKRFVTYLVEFHVLVVLTVLFLILLFLIYKEVKAGIKKVGGIYSTYKENLFSDFWGFLSVVIPGLDKVSVQHAGMYPIRRSSGMRIGRISLN
jgi:hypothetical protein